MNGPTQNCGMRKVEIEVRLVPAENDVDNEATKAEFEQRTT